MNNALDVARYVINYSNEKGYGISNLKLQKIMYFIQAYFLTAEIDSSPCFSEKIEAWDFGPVVPEVYHEFKQYGSGDIPTINSYIVFDKMNIWNSHREEYNPDIINEEEQKMINAVVDQFSDYSASDLVELTHRQAPWKKAYMQGRNCEITQDSIRRYFA
ncbi:MAG: Panacea domain-containing protein [Peptococcaceae bacterium]